MEEMIESVYKFFTDNMEWVFSGIGTSIVFALVPLAWWVVRHYNREQLSFDSILDSLKNAEHSSGIYVESDFLELVNVEKILKKHYPDYDDFIVVQYGSSVRHDVLNPNDYDFIVLLLGHSTDHNLHTFKVGTKPEKFIRS